MSVKIYNGVRFDTDIDTLNIWFQYTVKPALIEKTKSQAARRAIGAAVRDFDLFHYKGELDGDAKARFVDIFLNKAHEVEEITRRRLTGPDITVFPHNGKLYGIPFVDIGEFNREWIHDFGYWDNTDPPENLVHEDGTPCREWFERRRVWEAVLTGDGKSGVPSENGLSMQAMSMFYLVLDRGDHEMYAPDDRTRRKNLAKSIVLSKSDIWENENGMATIGDMNKFVQEHADEIDEIAASLVLVPIKDMF